MLISLLFTGFSHYFCLDTGGHKKHLQLFLNLLSLVTVLNTDELAHSVIHD